MESVSNKEALWTADNAKVQEIIKSGAANFFDKIPNIAQAFSETEKSFWICCMDEGIQYGLHIAGSGCGMDEAELAKHIKENSITTLTTHEGCGKWAQEHPENPQGAEAWGRELAAKLGVKHKHILLAEMGRPAEMHNARVAYIDGAGKFNKEGIAELPQGFVLSINPFKNASVADLVLALKIAFGDHGFGGKFNTENKFLLVILGNPAIKEFSEQNILNALQPAIEPYTDKVAISSIPDAGKYIPTEKERIAA